MYGDVGELCVWTRDNKKNWSGLVVYGEIEYVRLVGVNKNIICDFL